MRAAARLLLLAALATAPAHAAAQRPLTLVPQPREGRVERDITLSHGISVATPTDGADAFTARELGDALRDDGIPVSAGAGSARVVLMRTTSPSARAPLWGEGVRSSG